MGALRGNEPILRRLIYSFQLCTSARAVPLSNSRLALQITYHRERLAAAARHLALHPWKNAARRWKVRAKNHNPCNYKDIAQIEIVRHEPPRNPTRKPFIILVMYVVFLNTSVAVGGGGVLCTVSLLRPFRSSPDIKSHDRECQAVNHSASHARVHQRCSLAGPVSAALGQ